MMESTVLNEGDFPGEFICRTWTRKWMCEVEKIKAQSIVIYFIEFDKSKFSDLLYREHEVFFPPEIARSVHKRQAEFLCGRLAARAALRGINSKELTVAIGSSREPVWPIGVVGSITHSDTFAAATASYFEEGSGAHVGIDIETIQSDSSVFEIDAIVVDEFELTLLNTFAGQLPLNVLKTILFSAKESFYKAVFPVVKSYLDFDAITVAEIDIVQRKFTFNINGELCRRHVMLDSIEIFYDFVDDRSVITICAISCENLYSQSDAT